jgi:hypothetical protein
MKKNFFSKNPALANSRQSVFVRDIFRKGIPRVCFYFCSTEQNSEFFLFCGMVQNGIPRVFFYLCSMLQNSEHFSPLRKGSEQNSESFLFRGTHGIPPEQTNCSVYSVFRRIIFGRKLPTLTVICVSGRVNS